MRIRTWLYVQLSSLGLHVVLGLSLHYSQASLRGLEDGLHQAGTMVGQGWVSSLGTADGRDNLTSSSILTVIRSPSHTAINILYQISYKAIENSLKGLILQNRVSPSPHTFIPSSSTHSHNAMHSAAKQSAPSTASRHITMAYIVWCPSINCCSRLLLAGCPISQRLSVSADEIFRISVSSQSVEDIK
jgi:hypothetical protein